MVALLSHILLDWTNNYGVRPFFPFNARWYAGSIVFIFEPVLFGVLLLALVAPAFFGLIAGEVGARRAVFRGRGWAIFALAAMVGLWGWREVEHDAAVRLAEAAAYGPERLGAEVLRVTASPYPGNPYRWHTVAETPEFYQMATVDALRGTVVTDAAQDLFYKPAETPAVLAAKRSRLGEVYLDWSSWPLVTEIGPETLNGDGVDSEAVTAVSLRDMRFMYDTFLIEGRRSPPLGGAVYVDGEGRVVEMRLGSRVQR
jgi:inner membrane protein